MKNDLRVIRAFLVKRTSRQSFEYFSEDVANPIQDLMLEHGVLRRILLIYRHFVKILSKGDTSNMPLLRRAAQLVQSFIENYHERIEELYLFPVFKQHGVGVDLIRELENEHESGRALTRGLLKKLVVPNPDTPELVSTLTTYVDFYERHSAEEDTIIFPQFSKLVSLDVFEHLGELMEQSEERIFGQEGLEHILMEVASIEDALQLNID